MSGWPRTEDGSLKPLHELSPEEEAGILMRAQARMHRREAAPAFDLSSWSLSLSPAAADTHEAAPSTPRFN